MFFLTPKSITAILGLKFLKLHTSDDISSCTPSVYWYCFFVVIDDERFSPSIFGCFFSLFLNSSILKFPFFSKHINALQLLYFRIVFVSNLVSIPEMPGILFFINHSLKLISDRQLDSFVGCCLTTMPEIAFVFPSSSNLLEPMLPI